MNKVLYVGSPGFPKGLAQVQRQLLISKGIVEQGCKVLVLNRYGVHDKNIDIEINTTGTYEGVGYKFCSGTPFRHRKFVVRNLLKIIGFYIELLTLIKERLQNKANTLIITSTSFSNILYYTLLAKILNLTSVVDKVEYRSDIKSGFKKNIDLFFNDRYYGYFTDKAIVISDFLLAKLKQSNPNIPVIKIPAICDFSKFKKHSKQVDNLQYFLYCGAANYFEVIQFVIDAYTMLKSSIGLKLVVSGDKIWIDKVKNYLQEKDIKGVTIKSNIPYDDLVSLYENSLALLIPLRPTIQDIARFPHKLGEYTASKRPIISTDIGELSAYFKDGKNAYLSESYEIDLFCKKMQEVIDFPDEREKIAIKSFTTGEKEFDYQKNMAKLYKFIFNNE